MVCSIFQKKEIGIKAMPYQDGLKIKVILLQFTLFRCHQQLQYVRAI